MEQIKEAGIILALRENNRKLDKLIRVLVLLAIFWLIVLVIDHNNLLTIILHKAGVLIF